MTAIRLRHRGPRRANAPANRTFVVGIVVVILAALAFYVAITHRLPFMGPGGRLVTAYFSEPNQVQPGTTPVRVNGVQVGVVDTVSVADHGRMGRATLRITDSSLVLHRDATAALQWRTVLGSNFVVNLNPGSPSAPVLAGAVIPLSHTTVQTEFDDILRIFKHSTRLATRVDLRQLSGSMAGPQEGHLIDVTAPSLAQTPQAFDALRGQDQNDLSRLVSTASATVATLAADRSALENLVSGGAASLGAISAQRANLAATVQKAPAALDATVAVGRSITATLPALDRLSVALGPGAVALAPSAAAAQPAVIQLRRALDHLRPLLAELHPAINQLAAAAGPGDAVLTGLAPTLSRLNHQLLPWLNSQDGDLHMPVYELIAPTLAGLGSVASEYDGLGHVIHFPAQPELNSLTVVPCTATLTSAQKVSCSNLNAVLSQLLGGSGSSATAAARPAVRSAR
ncbi:MAG TPA: MlaD family protein [Solirubrobacteraceae bacterium]|nr:MlaD family protein [Solirubrobacteraceae bacterium]